VKERFIIWNYLIDLMLNNPKMEEGPIKILLSNDNFFNVSLVFGKNIIFFKIEINCSYFSDTKVEFSEMFLDDYETGTKRNIAREEDLIRLILPKIRDNKLKRIGI
jgi:hypothetical protein